MSSSVTYCRSSWSTDSLCCYFPSPKSVIAIDITTNLQNFHSGSLVRVWRASGIYMHIYI